MRLKQYILTYGLLLMATLAVFGSERITMNQLRLFFLPQQDTKDSVYAEVKKRAAAVDTALVQQAAIHTDSLLTELRADSVAKLTQQLLDSLGLSADSLMQQGDSTAFSHLDSLKNLYGKQTGNSKAVQWNDSVAAAEDSIRASKKESPLEAPVEYTAEDSVVFIMGKKNAYLYGDAKVNYTNIELKSEQIQMNMDSSIVHAVGVRDTLGKLSGTPIFKEGDDTYESETMSYNFKTRKGYITNVYTQQEDGFLTSEESKKGPDDDLYLRRGRYTTCDEEHPHFYIALSRAKVHTGKSVFSGPAWLVIEDVPLPLAIPFAYFPFSSKYSSGLIMPSYGDESTRGFYLRDGGYYFAINDYVDLRLTGEIYTKGSWGLSAQTTYKKRYKYSGNFYFNYQVTKEGDKNMPDYSVAKNFKLQWSHRQDPKSSPNSSFSASVNFATQSYEKNNLTSLYNPTSYSQSTRTSSISYSRSFPKSGVSISSSFNISQNMRDSTISLTLPSLTVSVNRFYPFKRKKAAGKERWYEKIAMQYTGSLSNSITTKESKLLKSNLIKDWRNGIKHSIPISASFTIMKYINVTPSFNYTERWYSYKVNQDWDMQKQAVVRDTVFGFNRVFDFSTSLSFNTKLYGMYKPNRKIFGDKIQMVRHVFTPSVSLSYTPDFGTNNWGYYKTYTKTDLQGNVTLVEYSPYTGSLYGVPGRGMTGAVNMDISNNIEMKIKSDKDSTGVKKISIIDELGASISYNFAAKTQPWSNLSTRLRLKWGKATFNLNAVFNTYAYEFDKNGNVIVGNTTEWSHGRFGRFQGMSKNLSYTFNNQSFKKIKKGILKLFGRDKDEDEEAEGKEKKLNEDDESLAENGSKRKGRGDEEGGAEDSDNGLDKDGYMKFNIPWSFSISYGITMSEDRSADINIKSMRYPYKFTHNLNFSGTLKLSSNWNISASSGWDFTYHKLSMTTVNISRDMHCFNMTCGLVFGTYTSYNITLRANASTLTDALKYDKKSSYSSSVKWY
ncbi:MAG: LPS-assembly protein LptD [Bacteroidaceae bacterium]|nr:LPS-assembly protein LptD [Bacteroidaceae bacterium]